MLNWNNLKQKINAAPVLLRRWAPIVEVFLILPFLCWLAYKQTEISQNSLSMIAISENTLKEMQSQTKVMKEALFAEKPAPEIEIWMILDSPPGLRANVVNSSGIEIHLRNWYDFPEAKFTIQFHNRGSKSMTSDSIKITLHCIKGSISDSLEIDFPLSAAKDEISKPNIITDHVKHLLDKMPSDGYDQYVTVSIDEAATVHGGIYEHQRCLVKRIYKVTR